MAAALAQSVATGAAISGRQSWRLLWASSKPLSLAVLGWAALDTFDGPLASNGRYAELFTLQASAYR